MADLSARGAPNARKAFWGKLTSTLPPPKSGKLSQRLANVVTWLHVRIFSRTSGRRLGRFDGAPACILHHRGAKSGAARQTPLVYLPDGDRIVIVASVGGSPRNPSWYHNLRAHPDVEIEFGGARRPVRARLASDDEANALWPHLLEMWPAWEDYGRRTQRSFPVFICEPAPGSP